jgi:hypothetical protein
MDEGALQDAWSLRAESSAQRLKSRVTSEPLAIQDKTYGLCSGTGPLPENAEKAFLAAPGKNDRSRSIAVTPTAHQVDEQIGTI